MTFNKSPQTGKTLLTMVFTIILCSLLVTPMVIALEFDNVATYNEETKVYTIENAFGLGEKIAEIELITPQIFSVGLGYQYVAEFELRDYDVLYGNAFQDMNFYQINSGMKEFSRDFDYRYLDYETDVRETYGEICEDGNCTIQEIGVEEYQKEIWTKFSDVNELPQQDNIRVRIYTDVKNKDYVEWIPTMYGEYLEEWAVWSGNLSSSLTSYYFFNDTTGNLIDYVGSADFTETGTVGSNSSGIIGNSRGDYSDANYFTNTNATEFATGSAWALSFWYNVTTNSASNRHMFTSHPDDLGGWTDTFEVYVDINSDEKLYVNAIYRGASSDTYTGDLMNDSEWHNVIVSQNASGAGVQVYVDGVWKANLAFGGSKANPSIQKEFGQILSDGPAESADGIYLDEAGIWSRGLTSAEASILWNNGDGCEYNDEDCLNTPVTITDISPVNTTNSTVSSVTLGVNVTDDSAVANVYLYIDGSLNNTNSSGVNGTYEWTYNFADGSYTWYVIGEDDEGTNTTMATYNFSVDTTVPTVNLYEPTTNTTITNYATVNSTDFTINWSSSDNNLDTCWYSTNETINITVTCNTNSSVTVPFGTYNVTVYANDSFGWESETTATPTYKVNVLENSQTYSAQVTEFAVTEFSLNITYNSSAWSSTTGILNYDGTNYSATSSSGTDTKIFNRTVTIPSIAADVNNTFYWIVRLTNSTGTYFYNSQNYNQTVINFVFDNCSVQNDTVFNLSYVDEDTQVAALADIEVQLDIYGEDASNTVSYNSSFTNVTNAAICINNNLTGSDLYLDAKIKYNSEGRELEYYNIQKYTLNTTTLTQNITLYGLNSSAATTFDIIYKGSNFVPLADAIINIKREYVSEGVFKTIEIPITDINGRATASLVADEGVYTLTVYKNAVLQATFQNVIPVCQNVLTGECTININAASSTTDVTDYSLLDNLNFLVTYDKTTRVITLDYSTISGVSTAIQFETTLLDQYENDTICNETLSAASGTLTCTIPATYLNKTAIVEIYSDGEFIAHYVISLLQDPSDYFGYTGYFFAFMFIVMIPLMFITSVVGVVIGIVVGVVILSLLLLAGGGGILSISGSIAWFLIAAGVLIWKLNQTERR